MSEVSEPVGPDPVGPDSVGPDSVGPEPVVSVALCTYQGARFVEEQVRSIRAQTVPVTELVLADDGSTDDGPTLAVQALGGSGIRVRELPRGDRLGVTANFERAIVACTGEIIALSDQDDRWHPDKLARILPHLTGPDAVALVHTDAALVDGDGARLGGTLVGSLEPTAAELTALAEGRAFDAYLRRNLATGATVVFRRDLLDVALPFPPSWVHDEWLAAIAAATGGVAYLPESTIDYRQHGANVIGAGRPSLRHKIARVLGGSRERNAELAERFGVLAERLAALAERGLVTDARAAAAREKADFEAARAALPGRRLARIPGVRALARSGRYETYASRGRSDIIRDLLQRG